MTDRLETFLTNYGKYHTHDKQSLWQSQFLNQLVLESPFSISESDSSTADPMAGPRIKYLKLILKSMDIFRVEVYLFERCCKLHSNRL